MHFIKGSVNAGAAFGEGRGWKGSNDSVEGHSFIFELMEVSALS